MTTALRRSSPIIVRLRSTRSIHAPRTRPKSRYGRKAAAVAMPRLTAEWVSLKTSNGTALDELVDDAREVRRIHAAPLRRFLQRRSVARLEPPEQLRLRIRQLEGLEACALVVERPREQVHQALDEFLSRAGLRDHYRYLTAFLDLGLGGRLAN